MPKIKVDKPDSKKKKKENIPKRTKLTDKQKKKIIADYIENNNLSETARMNNVNKATVKRIIDNNKCNPEFKQKATEKKEQDDKDLLDYMETIAEDQKEIIKMSMDAIKKKLKNPDAFTSVKDIAMVYGIIFDKALKSKELKNKQKDNNPGERKTVIVNDLPR